MSKSDSDEEDHKFELYETALKDAKKEINMLLKKKRYQLYKNCLRKFSL